jgi:tetratricopeptide (TPR) repeat protein
LSRLLGLHDVDLEVLAAIDAYLSDPDGELDIELQEIAAELAERVFEWRIEHAADRPQLAKIHADFGIKLERAGQYDKARRETGAAVGIYRELYAQSHECGAELALALTDLTHHLNQHPNGPTALETARGNSEEAIAIWEKLPGSAAIRPKDVGESYNALGNTLRQLGEYERALDVHKHALQLRRQYAAGDKKKGLLTGASLLNIGVIFWAQESWREAKKYMTESVQIYRDGIEAGHRGLGRIGLMRTLRGLAEAQWHLSELTDSIIVTREYTEHALALAQINPVARAEDPADALQELRARLTFVGRIDDALPLTEDIIEFYRKATNERGLATADIHLGVFLGQLFRHEEAISFTQAACQRLAESDEPGHLSDLAQTTDSLSRHLWELLRDDEARAATQQTIQACLSLPDGEGAATLVSLAASLGSMRRHEEAVAVSRRAVEIYRRLSAIELGPSQGMLATALCGLAYHRASMGEYEGAYAPASEAEQIYRRLDHAKRATQDGFGFALNILAWILSELHRDDEALACTEEAANIYRSLYDAQPLCLLDLAATLLELGLKMDHTGQRAEGRYRTQEAMNIYRQSAASEPGFRRRIADVLRNHGSTLEQMSQPAPALLYVLESISLYESLTNTDATVEAGLSRAMNNKARLLLKADRQNEARETSIQAAESFQHLATRDLPRVLAEDAVIDASQMLVTLNELGLSEHAAGIQALLLPNGLSG